MKKYQILFRRNSHERYTVIDTDYPMSDVQIIFSILKETNEVELQVKIQKVKQ